MVLGLDMRFLGRKWEKKNFRDCNSNKIIGLEGCSVGNFASGYHDEGSKESIPQGAKAPILGRT
jgi:hypothetical protein